MALSRKKIMDFIDKHANTEELYEIAYEVATEIECKDCPAVSYCGRRYDKCYDKLKDFMEEE